MTQKKASSKSLRQTTHAKLGFAPPSYPARLLYGHWNCRRPEVRKVVHGSQLAPGKWDLMQRRFAFDTPVILTGLTVLGMLLAVAALWPLKGVVADRSSLAGLCLVYLAGGLPAAWRALEALWNEHVLDIDLLMVVAAVAAAAVGAPSRVRCC